jgi:predicted dehydrogenase
LSAPPDRAHEEPGPPGRAATGRPLRVGVVGARQAVQGIGAYVAREFARAGCEVAGIVGTSEASVAAAQADLAARFGLACEGFTSLPELLARQRPDVVALCSPAGSHRAQLELALEAGAHVFCEKPLWWDETCAPARPAAPPRTEGPRAEGPRAEGPRAEGPGADELSRRVRALAEGFRSRGLLLALNTQWPCTLEAFRRLYPGVLTGTGPWPVRRFDMLLSPIRRGAEMVVDGAPHALSLLDALTGHGHVETVVAHRPGPDDTALDLAFRWIHAQGATEASLRLRTCPSQPRPAGYGIDGAWAERGVTQPGYRMQLTGGGRSEPLHDPLDLRVAQFVAQVRAGTPTDVQGLVESLANLRDLVAAAGDRGTGQAAGPSPEVPA